MTSRLHNDSSIIRDYYTMQAGGSMPTFRGSTIQRGSGIGGIFSKLRRNVVPILSKGAKLAGKQLLSTGLNIANDLIDGESFADSAKQNFKTGGKNLLSTLSTALQNPKSNKLLDKKSKIGRASCRERV